MKTKIYLKKFLSLLIMLVALCSIGTITTHAEDNNYTFDANYYAKRYPDVAKALGTDAEILYNHYLNNGVYEGRYICQSEETYYFTNGLTKPHKEKSEIQSTASTSTIMSNIPVVITPLYDNYIDVSIENQVVTYFEDGEQILQSPCVTGLANGKRNTPTGEFSIKCKTKGKRLKGPTWDCWVSRWMRFTDTACGFHDASWRSAFGGEIYKTDGSHGCVNLPTEFAKELFDTVKVGTKVVVH